MLHLLTNRKPFHESYVCDPNTGCWLWTENVDEDGYGLISGRQEKDPRLGTKYKAHRVSWVMHNGVLLPEEMVLHKCDTPPCVRPDHLFKGDALANVLDMVAKGRFTPPMLGRTLPDHVRQAVAESNRRRDQPRCPETGRFYPAGV